MLSMLFWLVWTKKNVYLRNPNPKNQEICKLRYELRRNYDDITITVTITDFSVIRNSRNYQLRVEVKPDDTQENSGDELDEHFENPEEDSTTLVRPIFLNEPYKQEEIILSDESINKLNGDNWLSTELLDFLIKHSTPYWLPSDVAIPTSNVERLLDEWNAKAVSNDPEDLEFVKNKRNEYKYFSTKPFRIYTFSMQKGHYFLLEMNFDGTDKEGDFFQYMTVYVRS